MKTSIISFVLAFVCVCTYAQQKDKWDSKNYIYQNYEYNFSWRLLDLVEWTRQQPIQKGAVFAANNLEAGIVAYVVMIKEDKPTPDIWNEIEEIKRGVYSQQGYAGTNNTATFHKCSFCGKHAIRVECVTTYPTDDRSSVRNATFYTTYYMVSNRGYVYTIYIMIGQDMKDALDEEGIKVKDLFFNGWHFVAE